MNIIKNAILNILLNNFMSHMYSTTYGCSISKFILEGLACMTNPKTTSRLHHAVLKCVYNKKCYNYILFLKVGNALNEIALNHDISEEIIFNYSKDMYYWRCHPNLNRIVTV